MPQQSTPMISDNPEIVLRMGNPPSPVSVGFSGLGEFHVFSRAATLTSGFMHRLKDKTGLVRQCFDSRASLRRRVPADVASTQDSLDV
jgi:hypothetical protein